MKQVLSIIAVVVVILLAVPSALVYFYSGPSEPHSTTPATPVLSSAHADKKTAEKQYTVRVFRVETGKVDNVPLESYVAGVVSGEMPAEFEVEALKSQALAARTYIVDRLVKNNFTDVPKNSHVTDTVKHQVYLDDKQLRERWGSSYAWKIQRIHQAISETEGKILTYEEKPIIATFFSTSNGYTENSEDYWGQKIPYLRSVAVPWDKISPRYEETMTVPLQQLEARLKTKIAVPASTGDKQWERVLSRTAGQRVKEVKIGDRTYTGRKVRELLDLNSSHFSMNLEKNKVVIHTRGYGHGVGMSQWGANGMAREGKKAEQIVRYFYTGVKIEDAQRFLG
jgi:stage II sporulation protein D